MKEIIKMNEDFYGAILSVSKVKKNLFIELMKKCKEQNNGYIELNLDVPKKPRSLTQNAKYWAMCTEFGLAMGGMTKEEVHEGVKDRACNERGYPTVINPISKKERAKSSAIASTIEFNILIEMLYQIAAESGYIFKEDYK